MWIFFLILGNSLENWVELIFKLNEILFKINRPLVAQLVESIEIGK